ncbi:hypothetical protein [Zavarzinella formosa]|uniref:hypothetical protein n=1 Tax=Zavarzinella formosa TaxID=360055 RepID=UPI0002E931D0|nr:hypothetical protein [Zavarzinella formosa]
MPSTSLIHDSAFRLANRLMQLVPPQMTESARKDVWRQLQEIIKEELLRHEEVANRMADRLYGPLAGRTT